MGRGRVDFDRGLARLSSYVRAHGHGDIKSNEVWLDWKIGLWVSNLRKKYRDSKLTDQQVDALQIIGIRLSPPYQTPKPKPPSKTVRIELEMLRRLERLEEHYRKHKHINISQFNGVKHWAAAGRWIASLRCKYRSGALSPAVIRKAEELNIEWNPGRGNRPK